MASCRAWHSNSRPRASYLWLPLLMLSKGLAHPAAAANPWPWPDEPSLLESLESRPSEALVAAASALGEGSGLALLKGCIARSWWSAAKSVVKETHLSSPDQVTAWGSEVTGQVAELKKTADSFAAYAEETYRGQRQGIKDEVNCALQWAQNSTHVFLGVKYATRWSAPGAIEVVDVNINVTECCFNLEAFGHHSSVRKRYSVSLETFAPLAPEASAWSAASVGRSTATLAKKRPDERWPRLMKSKAKSKHQITSWLDMEERWADDMDKLDERSGKKKKKDKAESKDKEKEKEKKGGESKKDSDASKNDTSTSAKASKKGWRKTAKSIWKKAVKAAKEPRYWFGLCGLSTLLWLALVLCNMREEGKLRRLQEELEDRRAQLQAAAAAAEARRSAGDVVEGAQAAEPHGSAEE